MPPKANASDRSRKELEAQRARAAALKHLTATGSGPSQSELARQQQERAKLVNERSAAAQVRVFGKPAAANGAASRIDPRVRDNTLQVVAMRRAKEMHSSQTVMQHADSLQSAGWVSQRGGNGNKDSTLPAGWKEALDPASGDTYYWNEVSHSWSDCMLRVLVD